MKLILASESPRRRDILQKAGFQFEIHAVPVMELKHSDDPTALPLQNALLKARTAAEDFANGRLKVRANFHCPHHDHEHGDDHTCGEHGCGEHGCH